MIPRYLDDWHWFLICYGMVLFQPLRYAEIAQKNKRDKRNRQIKEMVKRTGGGYY